MIRAVDSHCHLQTTALRPTAALLVDEAKSVAAATARSIVDAWERPKDGVSVTIEDVVERVDRTRREAEGDESHPGRDRHVHLARAPRKEQRGEDEEILGPMARSQEPIPRPDAARRGGMV